MCNVFAKTYLYIHNASIMAACFCLHMCVCNLSQLMEQLCTFCALPTTQPQHTHSLSLPLPLSLPPSLSSLTPPTLTLWVGTASGHTVTYGITVKNMTSGDDGGWSKGGSGGKEKYNLYQQVEYTMISTYKTCIIY